MSNNFTGINHENIVYDLLLHSHSHIGGKTLLPSTSQGIIHFIINCLISFGEIGFETKSFIPDRRH